LIKTSANSLYERVNITNITKNAKRLLPVVYFSSKISQLLVVGSFTY
jgi:hypothetical protein